MHITTIRLDLAQNIFQVHGITETGEVAFNRAFAGSTKRLRPLTPGLPTYWRANPAKLLPLQGPTKQHA